jgi:hypothetical protein
VDAYSTAAWSDLFVASAGAAAALSGLIFVAVSVNIRPILEADEEAGGNFLTGRALEAVVALANVLVISLVALTPGIHPGVLAAFILMVAAESTVSPIRAIALGTNKYTVPWATAFRAVSAWALTASMVAAGVTLAVGAGGGLDWLPVAFVLAVVVAATNAWVLLVEILR